MKNESKVLFVYLLSICATLLMIISVVVLSNVIPKLYNENWILGKTADEIVERYGEFDRTFTKGTEIREGAYLTKAERVGYLGIVPAEYCVIYFNADGYACAVEKNHVFTKDYIFGAEDTHR